ncbi:hypothetical protein [Paenibacillus radicis (ex Xue et al. 2023)]|uniref:Uncharacterized protein n=1 Tax=Paenibacillus radicis (ex Xue et al. 2023) TaxID=2972489 RepID=A0ABT1YMH8_9BACL|nr:hypothetical protein [Paenibacillus radicis (ex Xue et al. 2023)]MCR8633493.1 hypothetical protein [Paenibacillus radicis (ex Xue et al. 2023)]
MSQSTKKWVVDDIANAALFDLTTNDPVAFFEKLKKMTITVDAKQQREYGGTSKFAFHLTEQDSESGVQIENAVMDYNQLVAATGASITTGSTSVPTQEKLTVLTGATVTLSRGASFVSGSEKILVATKGLANSGTQLSKVASAPTAQQYTISASGVVVLGDATLVGKDIRVFYDYTSATAETASVVTTTKNKPYKFVAYGKAFDDELNTYFDVTIIIYKTQMLGTFSIDLQRKSATTNTMDLAVLDAGRPDGKVIDIIAS